MFSVKIPSLCRKKYWEEKSSLPYELTSQPLRIAFLKDEESNKGRCALWRLSREKTGELSYLIDTLSKLEHRFKFWSLYNVLTFLAVSVATFCIVFYIGSFGFFSSASLNLLIFSLVVGGNVSFLSLGGAPHLASLQLDTIRRISYEDYQRHWIFNVEDIAPRLTFENSFNYTDEELFEDLVDLLYNEKDTEVILALNALFDLESITCSQEKLDDAYDDIYDVIASRIDELRKKKAVQKNVISSSNDIVVDSIMETLRASELPPLTQLR